MTESTEPTVAPADPPAPRSSRPRRARRRGSVLSGTAVKAVVIAVVVAVVAGVGAYLVFGRGSSKTVTAQFASAVGVYTGTPVEILGIQVGTVTGVHPAGDHVDVTMAYDSSYSLPSDAISVIVANSLVSDRYIQLAPAYKGGPTLPDGATLGTKRTASPAELDDIYGALNKLSVALGPQGANKNGALSTLVDVGAANLKGNGAALGTTISKLSQAARTLADGRGDLFGTVKNLQLFTKALSDSDAQVRHFNEQLAQVAGDLASERADLGAALKNLGIALNQVAGFVRGNAAKLHTDLHGLASVTNILTKEQASLKETLATAPIALANIVHAYQPDLGVLPTRSNLASLTNPVNLCALLDVGGLIGQGSSLLGTVTGTVRKVCTQALKGLDPTKLLNLGGIDPSQIPALVQQLLGNVGGLGGIITGGG